MIRLHRLNGQEFVVNAELVESVESHGVETVIGMATGNRILVRETVSDVVQRCIEYRKQVYAGAVYLPSFLKEDPVPAEHPPVAKRVSPSVVPESEG